MIDVHSRLGNDDEAERAKTMFAKRLEEVKSYASSRLPDELGVVEGQDEVGGWSYPFGVNSMS